ncbi:MAG: polysaccharide biosynthesis protein [Bacteroidetes bacterium]|nr:polysaccharide biosynthesis protein [Bacteroidota bacterium]
MNFDIRRIMNFRDTLLGLPRLSKRAIVLVTDGCLCIVALWLAIYLRLGEFVALKGNYQLTVVISLALALPVFTVSGLYRAVFRYSGWPALMTVAKAISIYGSFFALIFTVYGVEGTPRTVGIIQPVILFLLVGLSRATAYYWLGGEYKRRIGASARERVLIYGAGSAGRQIAAALANQRDVKVVGFLDDDNSLIGQVLNGLTIYSPKLLKDISFGREVTSILLALPSVSRVRRQEIIDDIKNAGLLVRTLPSVTDIAQGRITINDIKDLDIDDLLGRQPVEPDPVLMAQKIKGKRILVTGAGGSIGSELCRQISRLSPASLILLDHSEYALYKIHEEIRLYCPKNDIQEVELQAVLASVKDYDTLKNIFNLYKPNTVFHAAAYKHVPLVEANISEGIRNNIFGTKNVAELSLDTGVEDFILISTDKAVRPTNVMGATKRWAELIVQNCAAECRVRKTNQKFSAVRFGNVLGSSGSVVPLFREQIKNGGPITITHPEVTRYFMSIPEAVGLVLQASSLADGGEIFLLDMGYPVRILDLAKNMIILSGLSVKDEVQIRGDIEIEIIGLRSGEKLHEELLIDIKNTEITINPKIYKSKENRSSSFNSNLFSNLQSAIMDKNLQSAYNLLYFGIKEDYENSGYPLMNTID